MKIKILLVIVLAAPLLAQAQGYECRMAQREVEVAASVTTSSRAQYDANLAEARRKANMVCFGAQRAGEIAAQEAAAPRVTQQIVTPAPDNRARFCQSTGGGGMYCY